ncbi:hypothetical protein BDV98DRAFT_574525 [Pterulicium gracile]|uniref:F-box domain-containing protein n=1 Tax=Pterulicium gracile TaxID=1884261 RepID=A0A5C3Q8H2_9AGAR|nr:hypothetical protein BDV98DRAFT_574525 [Pterula gracilis]
MHSDFPPSSRSQVLAPLTVSHVCWQWRQIEFSYPTLWSFIHVDIGTTFMNLRCVQTWIERSCSSPLTIILGSSVLAKHREMGEVTLLLLQTLSSAINRWRNVYVSLNVDDVSGVSILHSPGTDTIAFGIQDSSGNPAIHTPGSPLLGSITIRGALPAILRSPLKTLLSSSSDVLQHITILRHDLYRQQMQILIREIQPSAFGQITSHLSRHRQRFSYSYSEVLHLRSFYHTQYNPQRLSLRSHWAYEPCYPHTWRYNPTLPSCLEIDHYQ